MQEQKFRHKMNLQLFADSPETPEGGDPNPVPTPDAKPDGKPNDVMIPKARFDEVNKETKALRKQLDEILAAQKTAEEDAAKKRGEYEQLYTSAQKDLDSFKGQAEQHGTRVQALESLLGQMLNARLEQIPEDMRDIIPENLTPEAKLAWIEKASAKGLFGTGKSPETPVGSGTNPAPGAQVDLAELSPFQLLAHGYGSK